MCRNVAVVVKSVTSCCEPGSVGFGLFGSNVYSVPWVGHFFVLRYLVAWDPVKDIHAVSGAIALE